MCEVANKYAMLMDATSRFKAIGQPYEVWLDYQESKGIVFVKTGYLYKAEQPIVYCILTRHMSAYEWCKYANSLSNEGYSPILLNSQDLA